MRTGHIFVIIAVLAAGAKAASEETEYYAVFVGGKKMGYSIQTRVADGEQVTTTQEMNMKIKRSGTPVIMNTTEINVETAGGNPLSFKGVQDIGTATAIVSGTVDSLWIVDETTTSMGRQNKRTYGWPRGALMSEGLRLLQLEKGLKEGLEYSAKLFRIGSKEPTEVTIRVGPKKNIDLLGRAAELTEVKTIIKTPEGGEIVSASYVDENLRPKKSITPMLGTYTEIIACTKEFALSESDVPEIIDKMFLASPEPLNDIESAKSATYYLKPTDPAVRLMIPSTDNQTAEQKEGKVRVTVKPAAAPAGVKFPYDGKDSSILEATKPTRYLQSDHNDVISLAKKAAGESKDAAEAVKKIESFVSGYIEKRDLSVGYASAAEVAASKVGDCSEFAVLTAAMCRAIGIPARTVSGIVYVKSFGGKENVFGGHMWAEAYIGGKWVGLDATKAPQGFDAGHIALATGNGDPADFLNLAATLGQFKIDKVTLDTGKAENKP
ncbi:MAG: transglutaminase domain-containing protein [Sedimentisphaerales bacterium]|nr:transglutaminase domain-containing protein [Sedimentisphaerales bacterium]